jgi:hypothetical protein
MHSSIQTTFIIKHQFILLIGCKWTFMSWRLGPRRIKLKWVCLCERRPYSHVPKVHHGTLFSNTFQCANKAMEWGFKYQLWRPKEPASPTYDPNNTSESTLQPTTTTTQQYSHPITITIEISIITNRRPNAFKWCMWIY